MGADDSFRPGSTAGPGDTPRGPRLLDCVRLTARARHLAASTEKAYVHWAKRYVLFHRKRHPLEMGEREVNEFLTHLAVNAHVAASTQNQALAGLLFLYDDVLGRPLDRLTGVVRAKRPTRLPTVLTVDEVRAVLKCLSGDRWLVGMLLYGGGLRLLEALRLRVKDVDLDRAEMTIREAKGNKDRITVLPECVRKPLARHLERQRRIHAVEVGEGRGRVALPHAYARKNPGAETAWAVGVSIASVLPRPGNRHLLSPSSSRIGDAAVCPGGGAAVGHHETGHVTHLSSFLRHAPASGGL